MNQNSLFAAAGLLVVLAGGYFAYLALQPGADPDAPKPLVMTFVPSETNEALLADYEPTRAYLEQKLGRPVKLVGSTDYAAAIEAMRNGHVDFARFGPLSYVLAEREANAEVFAKEVRIDGQPNYHSLFVVPSDSPAQSLKDLKGKRVAFVDPASTSGFLFPSYIVKKKTGLLPAQYFSQVIFAGSHDAAEMQVKNKQVDAAGTNDITYNKMLRDGAITKESNRIISTSDPIPGIPIAWRKDLPDDLKAKLREAITTAHNEVNVSGLNKFLRYDPADPAEYQIIRDMLDELKLERDKLLKLE